MTDTEQAAFDLGVKAGLKVATDLLADRARSEHRRFEAALAEYDDEVAREALTRRNCIADILIDLGNILYPRTVEIKTDSVPEFNPHSDLPFELVEEEHYCQTCGSFDDLEFAADPYATEIGGDDTPGWYCDYCMTNSAMEI